MGKNKIHSNTTGSSHPEEQSDGINGRLKPNSETEHEGAGKEPDINLNNEIDKNSGSNYSKALINEENIQGKQPSRKDTVAENPKDFKNYKEKMYDKIPISIKTLDVIIAILITLLIILLAYFIIRRYY